MDFLQAPTLQKEAYSNFQIGKYIQTDYHQISPHSIVWVCVNESRGSVRNLNTSFSQLKENFYELAAGNWKLPLFDLGTLQAGNTVNDTYFALQEVLQYIIDRKAIPIIIGGSQDLVWTQYQVLAQLGKPINFTSVDSHIPLQPSEEETLSEDHLLSALVKDSHQLLFNFSNIGYQSYYTSYQIIDSLHSWDFEAIRLGEIVQNLKETEPIMRSSDIIALNLNALQQTNGNTGNHLQPNGFTPREICAISKYIGLAHQNKMAGIYNYQESGILPQLTAQMLWYLLEGLNTKFQIDKNPTMYKTYTVMHQDKEIVFLKDEWVNRWWIQLPKSSENEENIIIPCSELDYEKAKNNEMPERYWKNLKKFL